MGGIWEASVCRIYINGSGDFGCIILSENKENKEDKYIMIVV